MVFQSFFRFSGYFCNFIGFGGILDIFRFTGYFGNFLGLGCILVIFRF